MLATLTGAMVRPSTARFHVLKYLLERRNHPTIDMIYKELVPILPGLSKTSVYNTIGTLENAGLVRALTLEGTEMRYDAFTEDHAHFKCESCGAIYDIQGKIPALPQSALQGFRITHQDLFLRGYCPDCDRKQIS